MILKMIYQETQKIKKINYAEFLFKFDYKSGSQKSNKFQLTKYGIFVWNKVDLAPNSNLNIILHIIDQEGNSLKKDLVIFVATNFIISNFNNDNCAFVRFYDDFVNTNVNFASCVTSNPSIINYFYLNSPVICNLI